MRFQVSLTGGAKSDLRIILDWLRDRSPAGAETWYRCWEETLLAVRDRADNYGEAPESEDHPEMIRQVIFKTRRGRPYRALFVIRDRIVFVLHVRGPGQNMLNVDDIRDPDSI